MDRLGTDKMHILETTLATSVLHVTPQGLRTLADKMGIFISYKIGCFKLALETINLLIKQERSEKNRSNLRQDKYYCYL